MKLSNFKIKLTTEYPFRNDGKVLEPIAKALREQRNHTRFAEPQIRELHDDDSDQETRLGGFERFDLPAHLESEIVTAEGVVDAGTITGGIAHLFWQNKKQSFLH
jgi:hypothetical protein